MSFIGLYGEIWSLEVGLAPLGSKLPLICNIRVHLPDIHLGLSAFIYIYVDEMAASVILDG